MSPKRVTQSLEDGKKAIGTKKKKGKPKWKRTFDRFSPLIYMLVGAFIYRSLEGLLDKTTLSGQAFKLFVKAVLLDKSYLVILVLLTGVCLYMLYKAYTSRRKSWGQVLRYLGFILCLSVTTTGIMISSDTKAETDLFYFFLKKEYETKIVTVSSVQRGDGTTKPQLTIIADEGYKLEEWISGEDFSVRQGGKYKAYILPRSRKILSLEPVY